MGHSHGAGHSHGGSGHDHGRGQSRRALAIVLALMTAFTVAEVVGGLLTGSLALLADAGHMLSDDFSLGLALFAAWLAGKPATPNRSFGYRRAEILVAWPTGSRSWRSRSGSSSRPTGVCGSPRRSSADRCWPSPRSGYS